METGRPKAIQTPEIMWELFLGYKQWLKANPILKQDFVGKDGDEVFRTLERPMTWERFDCYVFEQNIITDMADYRQNTDNRYEDFKAVITRINSEMRSNKFEGASAGIFNANIIARDLGLVDKQQNQIIVEQPLFNLDEPTIDPVD